MKSPALSRWRRPGPLAGPLGLSLVVLLLGSADVSAQCSLCRDAAAASSPETREALNYAIIGLALAPYGVAALAVWMLSPAVRARVKTRFRHLARAGQEKPS